MFAELDHIDQHTTDVWTYWFKTEGTYDFLAGQYADVQVPHSPSDNRGDTRVMSFASAPNEALLGIITRFVLRGSTFKAALKKLQPSDKVRLMEPMGDFVLPKDPSIPIIFVAGGIGISPVRSIAQDMLATQDTSHDITVLYTARDEKHLFFKDVLENCPGLTLRTFTNENRLQLDDILQVVNSKPGALVFLSGTENMVYGLNNQLQQAGIPREQIVLDSFDGYDR